MGQHNTASVSVSNDCGTAQHSVSVCLSRPVCLLGTGSGGQGRVLTLEGFGAVALLQGGLVDSTCKEDALRVDTAHGHGQRRLPLLKTASKVTVKCFVSHGLQVRVQT